MAGQKLGKYEVRDRLGRGGMAEVYRAYHPNLDRYVAIKVLHAFLAEDDEFRDRFEKEARNIAKLNHAHIVQVYDFDYAPDRDSYYMVMELIDGVTLKDRLFELADSSDKLPLEETLRIVRESASALAYAHSRGMIHRDVKPANLMIDRDNRVVLTDFGIAKMLDSKQLTVSGGMIGTPAYMSPEQGLGEPGDERSDIYSLGVIMYQLLVGALPYDAETALGVILMHVNDPVPDVRAFDPSIPQAVQNIVNKAMAKDSEKRYQNADELIADLDQFEREPDDAEKVGATAAEAEPKVDLLAPPGESTQAQPQYEQTDAVSSEQADAEALSPVSEASASGGGGGMRWWWILLLLIILGGGGYVGLAASGMMEPIGPLVAILGSDTPTPTATMTPTEMPTDTPTEVPSETPTEIPSETPTEIPTETPTNEVSPTPTITLSPTFTPTMTHTPTETLPPSPTPDITQTLSAAQTATVAACMFDYAVVGQIPSDGEDGGFFPVNQAYSREITLLNTGTCPWGENTSMSFVSGEDFDAGPRIFVRESVQVGSEVTIKFEGTTPARGSLEPFVGTWQLRTRGQIAIGDPLDISVNVFDPGTG